jgi:hypothetical protein
MSVMRRLAVVVVLISLFGENGRAEDCVALVVARLGRATPGDADAVVRFAATIDRGSLAHDGLFAALSIGGDEGPSLVRNVLEVFPNGRPQFERLARVRDVPNVEKELAALGSGAANQAKGAASEIRYATDVLGPENVGQFQLEIPGGEPDVLDKLGNLHEVKYREWTSDTPPFLMASDLDGILQQADIAQRYAAATGKAYTLAFEVPVPSDYQQLFQTIFSEFMGRPNVFIKNGF